MILPLIVLGIKVLAGAAALVAAVVVISYADVLRSLQRHKIHDKDIGILVKQHLENGNVRLVGSVFSKRTLGIFPRSLRHEESFEGKLDSSLENIFRQQNRIKVNI